MEECYIVGEEETQGRNVLVQVYDEKSVIYLFILIFFKGWRVRPASLGC